MPFTNELDINLFPCEAISRPEKSESEGRDVNADCKVTLQPNLGSSCLPCCKILSVVTVLLKDDGDRHHYGEGQPLPLSSAVSCLTSPPIAIILPGMSPCPASPSSTPLPNQGNTIHCQRGCFFKRISMKTFHCRWIFWGVNTTMILLWSRR